MKDELLQQIEALIAEPLELLNLPANERMEWENAGFALGSLLEDHRNRSLKTFDVSDCVVVSRCDDGFVIGDDKPSITVNGNTVKLTFTVYSDAVVQNGKAEAGSNETGQA